jgi:uncharacterized protein YceH (UPF0502 family)
VDVDPIPDAGDSWTPVRTLEEGPRRVLGVLLEKAFTTPEYYPLTLKALTTGCNQKSNRDPVLEFSEDEVEDYVNELREAGLAALVQTEGGRAPRYRHLVRKRYTFTEPQLAVLTELWLRGRQQLGELRSRAGRMTAIDSLESLRSELQGLLDLGMVRASGALERRGVEVDHTFYPEGESRPFNALGDVDAAAPSSSPSRPPSGSQLSEALQRCDQLQEQVASLDERVSRLEERIESLLG